MTRAEMLPATKLSVSIRRLAVLRRSTNAALRNIWNFINISFIEIMKTKSNRAFENTLLLFEVW